MFQVCYAAADYHIHTFWSFVPDLMEFWLCESPATYLLPPYTNLLLWCKWSWLLPCSFSEKWTSQERMKRAQIIWLSNMKTEWEVIWLLSVNAWREFLRLKGSASTKSKRYCLASSDLTLEIGNFLAVGQKILQRSEQSLTRASSKISKLNTSGNGCMWCLDFLAERKGKRQN